jgi:CheY-like chemotaxis protein
MEQVILNLAINARDAMSRGGRLTVETANFVMKESGIRRKAEIPPGAYAVLRVSDTGVGMAAETLAHIFEPFFTTKGMKGTGLGLSSVYGIVKQSGGHISVESKPGKGSVFRILLPHASEAPAPADSLAEAMEPYQGGGTLLLVEDEEAVRELLRDILEKIGYRVLEARHGEEAMDLCERYEGKIDLLVTDVVMPRMGGTELYERLAALRPGIRVLYVSGYAEEREGPRRPDAPEPGFLLKPFTPELLLRKVRELLAALP